MVMTRRQRLAEQAADAAAERARRARPGQRIYRQTIAQQKRLNALIAGNAVAARRNKLRAGVEKTQ